MNWLRLALGLVTIAAVTINLVNVIGRYVFLRPIKATDEIMIFMWAWTVFLGAVVVSWKNSHLKIEVLSSILPVGLRRVISVGGLVILIGVLAFTFSQSLQFLSLINRIGQTSIAAGIPMVIPHSAIPIGFGLIILITLLRLRNEVLGPRESMPDEASAESKFEPAPDGESHSTPQ